MSILKAIKWPIQQNDKLKVEGGNVLQCPVAGDANVTKPFSNRLCALS